MKINVFVILSVFLLLLNACKKDDCEELDSCNCPPCFSNVDDNGNKVAWIPAFREGKWANMSQSMTAPDTIVFHNDSIWSNYNANGGTFENKYRFMDYRLIIDDDFDGNPLEYPWEFPTRFDDSTCILHLKRIPNAKPDEWDKYIRVE